MKVEFLTMPEAPQLQTVNVSSAGRTFTFTGYSDDHIVQTLKRTARFYEHDLLDFLIGAVDGDGWLVDVGANLGNHSVYLATHSNNAVIAIEPERDNLRLLRMNLEANSVVDRVEVHNCATWDEHAQLSLHQNIPSNRGTFRADSDDQGGIAGVPLDEIIGNRRVAAIKIDVEGAEYRTLKGATTTLGEQHPILSVEIHTPHAYHEISGLLKTLGYTTVNIRGASDNYVFMHRDSNPVAYQDASQRSLMESLRTHQREMAHGLHNTSVKVLALKEALQEASGPTSGTADVLADLRRSVDASLHHLETLVSAQGPAATVDQLLSETAGARDAVVRELQTLARRVENALETGKDQHARSTDRWESTSHDLAQALKTSRDADAERSNRISAKLDALRELSEFAHRDRDRAVDDLTRRVSEVGARHSDDLQSVGARQSEELRSVGRKVERLTEDLEDALLRALDARDRAAATAVSEREVRDDTALLQEMAHVRRSNTILRTAYTKVSDRLESVAPERWSTSAALRAIDARIDGSSLDEELLDVIEREASGRSVRQLPEPARGTYDRVRIGIASMPGREKGLATVLEILRVQAHEICVYLNGMDAVPDNVPRADNIRYFTGPDYGDRAKFLFLEGFQGYYLTCDDDIEYAPFHVHSIIDGIERYDRKAVVGWHGSIFSDDFQEFYNAKYRKVLSFRFLRGLDTPVHLLGTGVCGFHTSTVRIGFEDFIHPNMADAFLAIAAHEQDVPMRVLSHQKDWAKPIEAEAASISTVSLGRTEGKEGLDVASTVSRLIKDHQPWRTRDIDPVYAREPLNVCVIGRTDKERWRKGGILKSSHLTVDSLNRFGASVHLEDIETGDPQDLHGFKPHVVMIYVGDPERPDFARVEALLEHHASLGRAVTINLSINGKESRYEAIRTKMLAWERRFPGLVTMMVFSEAIFEVPQLQAIRHLLVPIPKTLHYPDAPQASFGESEGVFVGDIAKLSDDYLLSHPAKEWISAIRQALPEVPLYALQQYRPRYDTSGIDVDEVWPFLTDDFAERISRTRIMLSLVKYATFEMVPMEVASLGVPVVYQPMPQSLTEYLGLGGMVANQPSDLLDILPPLYNDPIVWRSQSQAGILRAMSSELNNTAGQMYVRLLGLKHRAQRG
ncbi:FkbM family methyltransferase [Kocuria sp. M1R5S2]|uniref:FkbM family methyltransferase n=1 Tax=Kocuria rhizosphaerae TaxID=3376285 RepID=UPI00378CEF5D